MSKNYDVPLSAPESFLAVDTGHEGWGRVLALSFPGLRIGFDSSTYVDPGDLKEVMTALRQERTSALVILVEDPELPDDALTLVTRAARAGEMVIMRLPVADFGVPDEAGVTQWQTIYPWLERDLMQGHSIAFACLSGTGRSPSFVARVLTQTGLDPDEAVARVRARLPEAIENQDQMDWARDARPGQPRTGQGDDDVDGQA